MSKNFFVLFSICTHTQQGSAYYVFLLVLSTAALLRCATGTVPKFRPKNSVFYSPIPADVLSMANFTLEFTTPFLDFSDSVLQTQQCTHDSSVIKREFLRYLLVLSFASAEQQPHHF